jgi:hypothetical protein
MNFTHLPFGLSPAPSFHYIGPQLGVQKAATLALTNGEIQPTSQPQANISWKLNFNGPAMAYQLVNAVFYRK